MQSVRNDDMIIKFTCNCRKPKPDQIQLPTTLTHRQNLGGPLCHNFKTHYKTTVIKDSEALEQDKSMGSNGEHRSSGYGSSVIVLDTQARGPSFNSPGKNTG